VPFLVYCPALFGHEAWDCTVPFASVDLMPTLLRLCDIGVGEGLDGVDLAPFWLGRTEPPDYGALAFDPAHDWAALRTARHTYVTSGGRPAALFDNVEDSRQQRNLLRLPAASAIGKGLAAELTQRRPRGH